MRLNVKSRTREVYRVQLTGKNPVVSAPVMRVSICVEDTESGNSRAAKAVTRGSMDIAVVPSSLIAINTCVKVLTMRT